MSLEARKMIVIVARDSIGRVLVRSQKTSSVWTKQMCDPSVGTIANLTFTDPALQAAPEGLPSDGRGFVGLQRNPRTTDVFQYWHNTVQGRENLGEELHQVELWY